MAPLGDDPTKLAFEVDTGQLDTGFDKAGKKVKGFKAEVAGLDGTQAAQAKTTTLQEEVLDKAGKRFASVGAVLAVVYSNMQALRGAIVDAIDAQVQEIRAVSEVAEKRLAEAEATGTATDAMREHATSTRNHADALDLTKNSLEAVLNPAKAVESIVKNLKIAYNNATHALDEWAQKNAMAGVSVANLSAEQQKEIDTLKRQQALIREILGDRAKEQQSLDDRAAALARIALMELAAGKASEATRRDIKATIDDYDREKREVIPGLQEVVALLQLQSSAQEDAAKKAEDKAKRHADAVRSEVDALEGSLESLQERTRLHLEAIAVVEKDGVVTAATADVIRAKNAELVEAWKKYGAEVPADLQLVVDKYPLLAKATDTAADAQKRLQDATREANVELRAQADEAERAAQDAEQSLADKKARLAELDKKSASGLVSGDESDEAFSLRGQIAQQEKEVQRARQRSTEAADELAGAEAGLADAQGASADQAAKLEAIETALAAGLITANEAFKARVAVAMENLGVTSDLAEETERLARAGENAGGAYRDWTRDMVSFSTEQGRAAETVERFGGVFLRTMEDGSQRVTNFQEEIGVLQEDLEAAGETGKEALGGVADEAERARDAVADAANPATLDPYLAQLREADKLWAGIAERIREANRLTGILTESMGDENDTGPAPSGGGEPS